MPNILQVTPPSVGNDNRALNNEIKNMPNSPQIHNPSDPSRVVRADGQEQGKTGTSTGEGTYGIVDYQSNYGAFIQKLMADGLELPQLLEQLLFRDAAGFLFPDKEAVGALVEQMLAAIQVDSKEELVQLFMDQQASQAKFTGPLFDGLRNVLSNHASAGLKDAVLSFLKVFNDHTSGRHLLQQMRSLKDDIGQLMMKHHRGQFEQLMDEMNWDAPNGEIAANADLINERVIPFLAKYISQTHDYGAIRDATMMFILHAVKYENGDEEKLRYLFEKMTGNREFQFFFEGEPKEALDSALGALGRQAESGNFADLLTTLLIKGTNGEAGLDNIQHFYNIINGMLLNESVYMPLLHTMVPFRYQDKDVMSEVWVDPDAKKTQDPEGRRIKMLLRFEVQKLGRFDLMLALQNRQVEMQLYVPPVLAEQINQIQDSVTGIIKNNGFELNRLLVREKRGDIRLEDVFPEIREKERTINVRI